MSNKTINLRLVVCKKTTAEWASEGAKVPLSGEFCVETLVSGVGKIKIGDGVKSWAQLPYSTVTSEDLIGLGYGDMLASKYATNADASAGWVDKAKMAEHAGGAESADTAYSAYAVICDHASGSKTVIKVALDVNESDPTPKELKVVSTDSEVQVSAVDSSEGKVALKLNDGVNVDSSGNITANSIKKSGGTASQFLKADRSTDSKQYIEASGAPVQSVSGRTGAVSLSKSDVGLANVDNTSDAVKNVASAAKLTTKRKINNVDFDGTADITIQAAASGGNSDTVDGAHVGTTEGSIPVLGASGKILPSMLPDYILGQLIFGGTIDAAGVCTLSTFFKNKYSITTLTLSAGNATTYEGSFFLASADASSGVPSTLSALVGDWVVSLGGSWVKIDNTDAVASVNGKTGVVTLTKADVGLGNVDNTSDANKPVSTAQQTALNAKVTAAGGSVAATVAAFSQSGSRTNIVSGETLAVIFGKLMKWFADLSAVAFSGSYSDLSNKPTLGTAAAKDIASSGNASTIQIVMGNDTRLSDNRTPAALSVTADKIAAGAVTDEKLATVNVSRLFVASGDTLILNGNF